MKEIIIVMRKMIGIIKDETPIFMALLEMINGVLAIPEVQNNPEYQEMCHKAILETKQFLAIRQVVLDEAQNVIDEQADDTLIIE